MFLTTVEEYVRVPYASSVGNLIYATHDLSQAVSIVSRYMHDPVGVVRRQLSGYYGTSKVPWMLG